ncbi:MAG TPA: SSI family serine proteinase inhibitor [Microlunatus sp.]|nr:SSI family serine proteinase inhibitor [Microlunatus sp.]
MSAAPMIAGARGKRDVNDTVGVRLLGLGTTVLLLGLLGCRSPAPQTGPSSQSSAPTPAAPSASTAQLSISVDMGQGGAPTEWKLTCNPAGGTHPDPVGACQALEVNGAAALPPVSKDRACTMIYGGPQRATVTGTIDGERVMSTFTRTNGCEIDRWSQLVPLLPEPTN